MASKKKHDDEKQKNVEEELSTEASDILNEDSPKEAAEQARLAKEAADLQFEQQRQLFQPMYNPVE